MLDNSSIIYIAKGTLITFNFTIISFIIGFSLGALIVLAKVSRNKALSLFADFYISIFRGTPVLVQLSIFYFALPQIIGVKLNAYEAGIITFSMNSAAYVAEILRGGINSIDKGQFEAAKSLSLPYTLTMRRIIFPQVIKNVLPALVNEFVNLLKETSIVSFIGVHDLMKRAQQVSAEQYIYFEPLLIAAICYYVVVLIFSNIANLIEVRLKR